jgi:hypothetical protein
MLGIESTRGTNKGILCSMQAQVQFHQGAFTGLASSTGPSLATDGIDTPLHRRTAKANGGTRGPRLARSFVYNPITTYKDSHVPNKNSLKSEVNL